MLASTVVTIARHSFREAVRKRLLLVVGLFALAMIVSAPFWPTLTDEDLVKLVQDISLTAMAFLGVIAAVFISAYSLPADVEEKRIFTLATKPVRRWQILLGKFLGFLALFALVLAAMGVCGDIMIRSVSTFSRVEVTAAEAPIYVNGSVVAAAGKGRLLRVLRSANGLHEVVLPDDLVVSEATIAPSDVEADRASRQLTVKAERATLLSNGVPVAHADRGTRLALKEVQNDSFLVVLPDNLRVKKAFLRAQDTSPPRWRVIRSKRIVESAARIYHNRGLAELSENAGTVSLHIGATVVQGESNVREVWRLSGLRMPASDAKQVDVLLHVAGLIGVIAGHSTPGMDTQLDRFSGDVSMLNEKTGLKQDVHIEAVWGTKSFVSRFSLPREMFDGSPIQLAVLRSNPEFVREAPDPIGGTRTCTWRFRNLKTRRFPEGSKVRGEMQFDLTMDGMPAHGGMVTDADFRVSRPTDGHSEVVTVPLRNGKLTEFSFHRDLIAPDGSLDITLESVPEPYKVGVSTKDNLSLKLLEWPVTFEWSYAKAVVLVFCQVMLVSGAAIAASTFVSGGVAALAGFFVYFCGLLAGFARELLVNPTAYLGGHGGEGTAQTAGASWQAGRALLKIFVTVVPDVSKLDGKTLILNGLDVPASRVLLGLGTTLAYVCIFLVLAHAIFRRKEFG